MLRVARRGAGSLAAASGGSSRRRGRASGPGPLGTRLTKLETVARMTYQTIIDMSKGVIDMSTWSRGHAAQRGAVCGVWPRW